MPVFSAHYRVYWSETDAAGIMHFSNYFRVCERAEEDLLAALGLWEKWGRTQIIFPRVHAECNYESPLYPGDTYRVDIDEVVIGNSSIEYRCVFYNETRGLLAARCRVVVVAYDRSREETIPVPEEIREKLLSLGARMREGVEARSEKKR